MNSLQETARIFTEINTLLLGQMDKRPEVKGEYYFTRNGKISDFLYKEYWEKLTEATKNLRGEILVFENPGKIPLVNILNDLLKDNVLLLEGNSNEYAQHIRFTAYDFSEWLKRITQKPRKIKPEPSFEELFRNKANAQKVRNALEEAHYTKNYKWAPDEDSGHKGNETEFVAVYRVLKKKNLLKKKALNTIGKVFMKEFKYPGEIPDRTLRLIPDNYYSAKFERIFVHIK